MTEASKEDLAAFLAQPAIRLWYEGVAPELKTSSSEPVTVYRCRSCRLDFDLVGTELRVVPKFKRRKVSLEDFV